MCLCSPFKLIHRENFHVSFVSFGLLKSGHPGFRSLRPARDFLSHRWLGQRCQEGHEDFFSAWVTCIDSVLSFWLGHLRSSQTSRRPERHPGDYSVSLRVTGESQKGHTLEGINATEDFDACVCVQRSRVL